MSDPSLGNSDRYDRGKPRKHIPALLTAIRTLFRQMRPPIAGLFLVGLLTLLAAVAPLATPLLFGLTLDALTGHTVWPSFIHETGPRVMFLLGLVLVAQAMALVLGYARDVCARRISQEALFALRTRMFAALQRRTLLSLEREQTGALMARLLEEPAVLESLFWGGLASLVSAPMTFLAIVVVLLVMDVELALVALIPVPLMALVGFLFVKRMRAIAPQLHERMANLFDFLQEKIAGMPITRLFRAEAAEIERFRRLSSSYVELRLRMDRLLSQYLPLLGFLTMLGMVLVLAWGSSAVLGGEISAGTLVAFAAYLAYFYSPLTEMSRANFLLQNAAICGERIGEVLEPPAGMVQKAGSVRLPSCAGLVELKKVGFWYDPGESGGKPAQVLRDVSMTSKAGDKVAIIGPTGSGKSTLAKILLGLYAPREGKVVLDGVALEDLAEESLALNVSAVLQDDVIFNDTVKANIAYGCRSADCAERVNEAARVAALDTVVANLAGGLDTVVGEGGERLSRGERQRLSIARAIVRKPGVLVLDEATSALDTETEGVVLTRVFEHLKDSTIIVMSHRETATRFCGRTLALVEGRLVEMTKPQ